MKRKGNTSDYTNQRNEELRAAFFSQGQYSTSDSVLKKTLQTPASRFWVDPDRARDIMSRIEKDPDCMKKMYPERKRMYTALYEKYCEIRRQFPDQPKIQAVTIAIYSGAPEFFLSTITGKHDDMLMTRAIGLHICLNEMTTPRPADAPTPYHTLRRAFTPPLF